MAKAVRKRSVVPAAPAMRLQMAVPRRWSTTPPFPFASPWTHYYYLARNAIYALAKTWSLADQEILFPAYCHGIEIETLHAAGVKPRFYPVSGDMRVDVDDIRNRLAAKTRAVYLIHYVGFPGPVQEVAELCQSRGLLLIEDCALALLSAVDGIPLGSFGDAAIFCLYKTLPVPHGGALVLRKPGPSALPILKAPTFASTLAYAATALRRDLSWETGGAIHKIASKLQNLSRSKSQSLGVAPVGANHLNPADLDLAMSGMCRWILAAQHFDEIVARRRSNYLYLLEQLREFSPPVFGELPPGVCPLFYPLRHRNKPTLMERLRQNEIETVNFWSEIPPSMPQGTYPDVDELRRTIIELPCHQDLTPEEMKRIADTVCGLLQESFVHTTNA
jgi:perosamine synthetase